jgi:DNA-binding XRE family transcriptional regulator
MTHSWKEVRKKLSPEREARMKQFVEGELKKLPLYELRQARNLTQENLAHTLHVPQSSVSKLERRADMYLSTLRSYIEAMGGELSIRAVFPDGEVQIEQLQSLQE